MAKTQYLTSPRPSEELPRGIPYIVGNEAAERFSFYGMRSILYAFMTGHLLNTYGDPDYMNKNEANVWVHSFVTAAYFFPIFGAFISDWLLGKYRTIISLSLLYCVGHGVLALLEFPGLLPIEPRWVLWIGLSLIALGAGGIKPCVSAHVGDQFGSGNKHLLPNVFRWFYFSINLGSALSTILTPILLAQFGPGWAFGVPGVLMALALFVFWLGRHHFVHIPASGNQLFTESFSKSGRRAIFNLIPLYLFIAMFWALFDQTSSAWIEQAKHMDRTILNWTLLPSHIQAANPFLVLALIPVFSYWIYPFMGRFFEVTPLRKIGIGLFTTIPAFLLPGWLESRITAGETPHIAWHFVAYLIITMAEVMVSITALEFSYTQAPKKMKSFVMGLFFLSVALGNYFTAKVNEFIIAQKAEGVTLLDGANYYWFFSAAMAITACIYVVFAQFYRGNTYIQDDADENGEFTAATDPTGVTVCSMCGTTVPITDSHCGNCGEAADHN